MPNMIRSSALLLSFALAAATASYCQSSGDSSQYQGHAQRQWSGGHGHFRGHNPEFETKMLTRRLNLTTEQAAAIEPILAQQDSALRALRPTPGTQPDFKTMQASRKAIMEQTRQQMNQYLSQEQQSELARMHEHHGPHGNWSGKSGATGTGSGA